MLKHNLNEKDSDKFKRLKQEKINCQKRKRERLEEKKNQLFEVNLIYT